MVKDRGMESISLGPDGSLPLDINKMMAFSHKYHEDAAFRAQVEVDARDVMIEHGFVMPSTLDVRVVANDDDTFHFVLPPDPNIDLEDEALSVIAGGKTASSAGSASTIASLPSCASSAATASSVDISKVPGPDGGADAAGSGG